jgi:hypothetical protein
MSDIYLNAKAAGVLVEVLDFILDDGGHQSFKLTPTAARLSAQYLRGELDETKQDEYRIKLAGAHSLLEALRAVPVGQDALAPVSNLDDYRGADHD